ncbi:MAG: hypothetical protein ABW046_20735 [Actinoplanes sp.]
MFGKPKQGADFELRAACEKHGTRGPARSTLKAAEKDQAKHTKKMHRGASGFDGREITWSEKGKR